LMSGRHIPGHVLVFLSSPRCPCPSALASASNGAEFLLSKPHVSLISVAPRIILVCLSFSWLSSRRWSLLPNVPKRAELLTVVRRYGLASGRSCLHHLRQLASPAALYATILYCCRSYRQTLCVASSLSLSTRLGSRRAMAAREGWQGLAMVVRHCYFRVPRYGRTPFHAVVSWLSPSPLSCIFNFKHCLQHRRCRAFFILDASNSFPSCATCPVKCETWPSTRWPSLGIQRRHRFSRQMLDETLDLRNCHHSNSFAVSCVPAGETRSPRSV
jgi:hypothetical protein